ncbi:MAG: ParB family protein [Hymenobacter sp.]|nr:ParB family protein [Hymenobacter sp.]
MAKASKKPGLKAIVDASGALLKAGQWVVVAPGVPINEKLKGRSGQVDYIEEAADRGMVTVQFPAVSGFEAESTEFICRDLLLAEPPVLSTAPVQHALQYVPLLKIDVLRNTRQQYDEPAMVELVQSIEAHGVLQSILVRPHPERPDRYQLAAGHRRYFAAQRAMLEEIPATIRQLTDREFLEVQLLENLQRQDVHPADEAVAFAELLDEHHFSAEEIALKVGKPVKFVLQRAKLVALSAFWMELLRNNGLALAAAHELARLPHESQLLIEREGVRILGNQPTYNFGAVWIRSTIKDKVLRELGTAAFPKDDAELYPLAGPCTTCPKRSGACHLLFEEDDLTHDLCLDGTCFAQKKELFVARRQREVKKETGKPAVLVSINYYQTDNKAAIDHSKYREATPETPGAVAALLADGVEAGATKWVLLDKGAAPKSVNAAEEEKAERAATIRSNRIKRQINELQAAMLRQLFSNEIGSNGPAANALINSFLESAFLYGYSRTPKSTLEYLHQQYGWPEATGADLDNQYRSGEKITPHQEYLQRQLRTMSVVDKVVLYFDLKFRSGLEQSEVLQVQQRYVKVLPLDYRDEFDVAQRAEQLVEEQYYSKGPRKSEKQNVAEIEAVLQKQFAPVGEEVTSA